MERRYVDVFETAGPIPWPVGKVAAASFTFDLDAESAVLYASAGSEHRAGVMSHQAYGPLAGVPRLLNMLERTGICATFFVPGYTAERYPQVVKDIVLAGHEIGHHGYMHESLEGVSEGQEAAYLDKGLQVLEDIAGVRPVGYRAPMWEPTYSTARLLEERGFLYDSTFMDSDHPYELATGGGRSIVEIPIQWALDDWEQYCFIPDVSGVGLMKNPREVVDLWRLEYEAMRDENACYVLTNHPFLSGRPSRARALEGLIKEIIADSSVWVASLAEIATHVRTLSLKPRIMVPPVVKPEYRNS